VLCVTRARAAIRRLIEEYGWELSLLIVLALSVFVYAFGLFWKEG